MKLAKRISRPLKIWLAIASIALLAAWMAAWPSQLIDASRKNNLLLTVNNNWLSTAAPASRLFNYWWPDHDTTHGRIMVHRPSVVDTTLLYPAVVVVQQSDEDFKKLSHDWQSLDSCYVMVVSQTEAYKQKNNVHLQMIDSTLIHWLNHCGMRIDPNYITLVDRTKNGRQAKQFSHRRLRNLIVTSPQADTTPQPTRRYHLLPQSVKDTTLMAASFRRLLAQGIDADLYEAGTPMQRLANEIALERRPIAQTRIINTHRQAIGRGYDERYAMFVDFSIPSGKNRFFLYDYDTGSITVRSKCAHGCGSGSTDAVPQFSNAHGSNATSLGLYEIDDVHRMYKNGRVAINLEGLEETNDNARMRGIKVHGGMRYEGEIYPRYLRIGRLSEGCFALSNVPLAMVLITVEQTAPRRILLTAYTH